MAKTDYFAKILKSAGNEYAAAASAGIAAGDVAGYISTGSYTVNALFSGSLFGGIPSNKITALAGSSGVGKTYISLSIAKTFLDQEPDGAVFYFETESAISRDMLVAREIDTDRIFIIPVNSVQEFRSQALKIIEEYEKSEPKQPMIFILDSLGNLSTEKEISDMSAGKDTRDMTRAQLVRGTFRVLTLKLGKLNLPLIVTNHTYISTGYIATEEMSGGGGIFYAASSIAMISRRKEKDDNGVVGNVLKFKLKKGRLTKENKEVHTLLRYDTGLDRYYGLIDIADACGYIKKDGNKWAFPNGEKAFEKSIISKPEKYWTKDVLLELDELVKKNFCYGMDSGGSVEDVDDEVECIE